MGIKKEKLKWQLWCIICQNKKFSLIGGGKLGILNSLKERLFKSDNNNDLDQESIVINVNLDDKISRQLKEATYLKNNGNINKAIELLKTTNEEMSKSEIIYSVSQYLRLPLYQQQAGLNDEAWKEFNILKLKFTSDIDQSIIEDKMRLFLQREKKFNEAIWFGILSYMHSIRHNFFLTRELKSEKHFQAKEIEDRFIESCSNDGIRKVITPLLNKAKRNEIYDDLFLVLEKYVKKMPNIDFMKLRDDVAKLVNTDI